MDTRSYSASFLHLNRLFESLSFCAECSDVFYKGEFNAANSLPASDAEEFFARNSIISIENTQSEVSDGFAQFRKVPSEVSDTSAQFGKVPSEVSDVPAQFRKMPSETSDGFTAIETCSFYSVDSYFCTQGFGLILPFFKNLRENLKKTKKLVTFIQLMSFICFHRADVMAAIKKHGS